MVVRVLEGDARSILATLPSESAHCVVTFPPGYFHKAFAKMRRDGWIV
jgi:DNA modification methylase